MGDSDRVVDVAGVAKAFGEVAALSDLHLVVPPGRITVLLGPNGAGKTTAIRLVTGALSPDVGTVRTFGLDPAVSGEEVRRRCGVVSAKPALYDRLSGFDNLAYSADLYGVGRRRVDRIRAAAERFGIHHALDQQVGGYSTGMKTRLALARSILHDPQLLLFDEPTSGLDPESSAAVLQLIRQMTAEGRTVVMCTHLLVEAEGLADQVIILEAGTDLLTGSPAELTRRYWPHPVVRWSATEPERLAALADMPGVVATRPGSDADTDLEVEVDDLSRIPDLVGSLVDSGVRLTRVDPHEPTLEELYFAVREERRRALDSAPPSTGAQPRPSPAKRSWPAHDSHHPASAPHHDRLAAHLDRGPHRSAPAHPGPRLLGADASLGVDLLPGDPHRPAPGHHQRRGHHRGTADLTGAGRPPRGRPTTGPLFTPSGEAVSDAGRTSYTLAVFLLAPVAVIVPLTISTAVGAATIVGERERGTGEFLAHSPADVKEIYGGKLIASLIPGYLTTVVGFGLYSLIVNSIVGPEVGGWFFPTRQWWLLMFWVVPPFLVLTLSLVLRLSARVKSTAAAQQASGLITLPLILVAYSQSTGALFGAGGATLAIGALAWCVAVVSVTANLRAVTRARLLGVADEQ